MSENIAIQVVTVSRWLTPTWIPPAISIPSGMDTLTGMNAVLASGVPATCVPVSRMATVGEATVTVVAECTVTRDLHSVAPVMPPPMVTD